MVMSILNFAARSRIVFSLVVPEVTMTLRPARSRNDLTGEPFFTSSLVPETKKVGENATCFWRSRLLVVEPHSRSTCPDATAAMRESDVTGCHLMETVRPTSSPIASTSCLHRSIE